MIDPQAIPNLPGVPVLDVDGGILGSVERVYVHQDSGAPLWVSIRTDFDGAPTTFAPLDSARFDNQDGSALHIDFPRSIVEDAPVVSSVDDLTLDDVHALRDHYRSGTPAPVPATADLPSRGLSGSVDVDLVRSEEQLRISTVSVPRERVRFQKVIVTEEKTITVVVHREELRVIREPLVEDGLEDLVEHPAQTTGLEIVLHEERVVVTTEAVPVERVRVVVTRVVENLPVTDTLRKEKVEVSSSSS